MRVFIVDDSAIVRSALLTLLSSLDDVELVGEASSGQAALESIRRLKPDVVILDIHMADGPNGIRILEQIKKDDDPPVIVMLTNYSFEQYRRKCLEAGADFFFDKSTEFEKVPEVLKALGQKPGKGGH